MPHKPIVTIKLTNAHVHKAIGPNTHIKIKVADGPVIQYVWHAGINWIYQAPAGPGPFIAHVDFVELDPVYTDTGSIDQPLSIVTSTPPQSGTDVVSLTVYAVGGDAGKSATSSFTLKWWVSSSAPEIAEFIVDKMKTNAASSTVAAIKAKQLTVSKLSLNPALMIVPLYQETQAMRDFADLVGTGKVWDYKTGAGGIQAQYGDYALDPTIGRLYRFDTWGNIHYGYIGRAVGFSEDLLLDAAGFAQAQDDGKTLNQIIVKAPRFRAFDPEEDQACIRIGMSLWKRYGMNVTAEHLLRAMRRGGEHFNKTTKNAPEGVPPDSFLEKLQ